MSSPPEPAPEPEPAHQRLIDAVRSLDDDVEALRLAFEASGLGVDHAFPRQGHTLLHLAASAMWPEADDGRLTYLLSLSPNLELRAWPHVCLDWTPLMLAVYDGTFDKAQTLLAAGADVNATDICGFTPLILAQYAFDAERRVPLILAAGADPQARDHRGRTHEDHAAYLRSLSPHTRPTSAEPWGGPFDYRTPF